VRVIENQPNGWANVSDAKGWRGWVDGRRLVAPGAGTAASSVDAPFGIRTPQWWPADIALVPAAGAALVLFGSFLPWLSVHGASASAWDISLTWLLSGNTIGGGLKIGFVLLAVVAVAIPALTKRPLPDAVLPTIGLVAMGLALVTLVRGLVGVTVDDIKFTYDPGIGLFISLVGGGVLAIDRLRAWTHHVRAGAARAS